MKHLIICFTLVLASHALSAQNPTLTPEVIATAGETFTSNEISLEWTLGELMTETYAGTLVLTQGFHQPEIIPTSIDDFASDLGKIKVYPNPTAERVFIEKENQGTLQVALWDIKGSIILQQSFDTAKSSLDLSQLPRGFYVLRMRDGKQAIQSIKIQKM